LESKFRFVDFSTAEFKKNPTGVSRIKTGIRILLPVGVPEIGTKNWNSQPRSQECGSQHVVAQASNAIGCHLAPWLIVGWAGGVVKIQKYF
jgi:hypothetical protein